MKTRHFIDEIYHKLYEYILYIQDDKNNYLNILYAIFTNFTTRNYNRPVYINMIGIYYDKIKKKYYSKQKKNIIRVHHNYQRHTFRSYCFIIFRTWPTGPRLIFLPVLASIRSISFLTFPG